MKRCGYCGHPITGDAVEIAPESASGARPTAYWHRDAEDCVNADETATGVSSPLRRLLSRL
ncbi:hypothetical protein MBT42_18550 [Streptomyces sp. MBT42]|uniref:hypothetical protein n=1 Tax=Streptomyces sp. MBT42 TaxID=1488373 RepID=UPI001E44C5A4|nr:hypothetical protein [Streptomyces sp. MBT42]MCD2461995.1 hypothetical protein [Streptomyces sp. MBT42]MCD2465558.1 hypothetical protein [Streptomyces sp. MBT42]